ncbi:hypothetical protein PORCRE_597 [Porphyromonas crevioricanis JCM 15906]|uniref:Uncharacterized protein n=1 Tax=Porphyromonas crevioricanis JCM 15906 TaxID=1305617 RepID=T1DQQ9_9PORP|nr:hypothetical protein PORCRE_597 [Porphyromonas crevioricanis JCM 15906]GAD06836.1 hypothetical protein PORCAN_444 [Porphyromonas crevioricanis JCM 13913]
MQLKKILNNTEINKRLYIRIQKKCFKGSVELVQQSLSPHGNGCCVLMEVHQGSE